MMRWPTGTLPVKLITSTSGVPVMVLARLAVDVRAQGMSLGASCFGTLSVEPLPYRKTPEFARYWYYMHSMTARGSSTNTTGFRLHLCIR